MPIDPSLCDLLHGIRPSKNKTPAENHLEKRPFDAAFDLAIKKEVDQMIEKEDPSQHKLLTLQSRRAQLEQELRSDVEMSEFGTHLINALNILRNEGKNYLENEEYEQLIQAIDQQNQQIAKLEPSTLNDENLLAALTMSQANLASILKVGIDKYSQGLPNESLSIFSYLSSLDATNPDYWYRLGLVAQTCEQFDLALRAFAATAQITPEFIGNRIFAAQCYLHLDQREAAIKELEAARSLFEKSTPNEEWQKHIEDIENLLAANLIKEE